MPININDITEEEVITLNRSEQLVVVSPTSSTSLQQQIDDINSKFPISDTKVVSETDYLANYLINRGTL